MVVLLFPGEVVKSINRGNRRSFYLPQIRSMALMHCPVSSCR
jgi:hypothetical protein